MSRGTGPGCPGAGRLFGGGLLLRRRDLPTRPLPPLSGAAPLRTGTGDQGQPHRQHPGARGSLRRRRPLQRLPRLCHHPHRPRDLPLPPAGPGAAGPPSGGGGPAAPELSDLSHRPHPLPQRPAGFPGCGGYGGPGGPLSAQQPLLWRSGVLRLRSGPPAGHQPRLGVSGLSGLGTGRPDPAGGTGHLVPDPAALEGVRGSG